jgi:biotin carboxyl carrier protein
MKMEQLSYAPHDGIVTDVCVAVGDQIDARALLAVLTADHDPV